MIHQRHPTVVRTIIEAIESNNPSHTAQGVVSSMESLRAVGCTIPSWEELILAENQNRVLGETEVALLRSQGGPLASVPFTSLPTMRETSFDPQPFRLLLLRRLRLPLPLFLSARWPSTRLPWPPPISVLEGGSLVAHWLSHGDIFREAGARVRTNVMVRDLDLGAFNRLDGRRLEIIADGLPLWREAQLAVDTTLVSPIKADGTARRHAARRNGIALEAARKAKERKYPELAGRGGRARLVVVGAEVGGRFSSETPQFLRGLVSAKVRGVPPPLKVKAAAAWMRRWSSVLGGVVANSFALSLLGRVPPGADGEVPSLSDVLGADRYA